MGHKQQDADTGNNNGNKTTAVSELEEEIQKYQLRQKIQSQYTASALESFLNSMGITKKNDTGGILFKDKNNDALNGGGEKEKQQRQHLIKGISSDVDIQLNNLERMIKEVAEKVKEYELLSFMDSDPVVVSSSLGGDAAASDDPRVDQIENIKYNSGGGNDNGTSSHPEHGNQFLSLSKECADLLADLLSTISKAMELTIRTTPHSFSIEF